MEDTTTKEDGPDSSDRGSRFGNIVQYQFDLEILNKYRELRVLESELERGRQLLYYLEKLLLNEHLYGEKHMYSGRISAPPFFDRREPAAGLLFEDRQFGPKFPPSIEPTVQYEMRSDGTVLKMQCPRCHSEKFRSMLGFLNHCRINCKLQFSSQEDKLQRCGVPVDPDEVPPEYFSKHPTQIKQEIDLAQIRADLGPSAVSTAKQPSIAETEEPDGHYFGKLGLRDASWLQEGSLGHVPLGSTSTKHAQATHDELSGQASEESRYYVRKRLVVGNTSKIVAYEDQDSQERASTTDALRPCTHKWRLYVRSLEAPPEAIVFKTVDLELLSYIRHIKVYLHPSYRPYDVEQLDSWPFELERLSWGESPVRLQLHFWDPRNKPIDIIHILRLYGSHGRREFTFEYLHEIDLDKSTVFRQREEVLRDLPKSTRLVQDPEAPSPVFSASHLQYKTAGTQGSTRHQQLFPPDARQRSVKFCRFCGVSHNPQEQFDVLQKYCTMRPRKVRVNSKTMAGVLFEHPGPAVQAGTPAAHRCELPESAEDLQEEDLSAAQRPLCDWISDVLRECKINKASGYARLCMAKALECFLRQVAGESVGQIPAASSRSTVDQKSPAVVTPLHIYLAAAAHRGRSDFNVLDFLTNAYFAGGAGADTSQNISA